VPAPLPVEKQAEIVALRESGMSSTEIMKETGVSWPTVWKYRDTDPKRFLELVNAVKRTHAERYYVAAGIAQDRVVDHIEKVPIETAGDLRNVAVVSGVMLDKALAIEGKAPGQQNGAFNLYVQGDGSQVNVQINETEARNMMQERTRRARDEQPRLSGDSPEGCQDA
jgi:hypothetical protein